METGLTNGKFLYFWDYLHLDHLNFRASALPTFLQIPRFVCMLKRWNGEDCIILRLVPTLSQTGWESRYKRNVLLGCFEQRDLIFINTVQKTKLLPDFNLFSPILHLFFKFYATCLLTSLTAQDKFVVHFNMILFTLIIQFILGFASSIL